MKHDYHVCDICGGKMLGHQMVGILIVPKFEFIAQAKEAVARSQQADGETDGPGVWRILGHEPDEKIYQDRYHICPSCGRGIIQMAKEHKFLKGDTDV